MLKEESEGGMMIAHCSGAREKEQFWSKMLRIMGDAQSSLIVTTKAVAGAQMAIETIIVYVVGHI